MSEEMMLSGECEVYCFDYYDTIAYRTVEPEYVKKIWSRDLAGFFMVNMTAGEIYSLRNATEAALCAENEKNGYDAEFRYHDLTAAMYKKFYGEPEIGTAVALNYFQDRTEEMELAIESRVQKLCEDTVAEIRALKAAGKKIVCISDFYTSAAFLDRLLTYHGIRDLFDEIYVSSELLVTKRSGRLYDEVLKNLGVDADQVMMVGDNQWSDYESALQKGMKAYLIDRSARKAEYQTFLEKHSKPEYLQNELEAIYRNCNREQYEDLAFSLYYFIDKLYDRLRLDNRKDVFFLSREGEFLKKIFDFYQERRTVNGLEPIRSHYLMVSRKATFIASLKPLEEENFEMIFRQYVNISLYDFLSSLGFAEEVQKQIGERLHIDIYEKQTDLPRTGLYAAMIQDSSFREKYETLRQEQRQNFDAYLKSFGVDFAKDGMCLVDVGWKGTIQDNILMFFDEKIDILGLYLGLVAPGKEHPYNRKEGLLFTAIPAPQKYFYVYDENKSVFEVMLGASHGSADHYVATENGITVATSEKQEERDLYLNMISPMQRVIFGCIEKIDEVLLNHSFDKTELEQIVAGIHAKLVFLPKNAQIDLFYHIYHYENFGVFEFTKFKTKDHISITDRIRSVKRIFRERRGFFQSSFWGVVALKDAGLGILIRPYGWYRYHKCYRKER